MSSSSPCSSPILAPAFAVAPVLIRSIDILPGRWPGVKRSCVAVSYRLSAFGHRRSSAVDAEPSAGRASPTAPLGVLSVLAVEAAFSNQLSAISSPPSAFIGGSKSARSAAPGHGRPCEVNRPSGGDVSRWPPLARGARRWFVARLVRTRWSRSSRVACGLFPR